MNSDQIADALDSLEQSRPFSGLIVIKIDQRPLIKAIAKLADFWETICADITVIKELSNLKGKAGGCALYGNEASEKGQLLLVLKTEAVSGKLTFAQAVLLLAEPQAAELAARYGCQLAKVLASTGKQATEERLIFEF